MERFELKNVMQAPSLVKVCVNMGLSEAKSGPEAQQTLMGVVADEAAQHPLLDQQRRQARFALVVDDGVPEEGIALVAAEDGDRR